MPRRLLYLHLRSLVLISLIWIIFGVVFFENLIRNCNDLGVRVELYQFSIAFGLIGAIISAVIIFYLKPAFSHHPVWRASLYKLLITLVLFFFIAFLLLFLYYLFLYKKSFHFGHFLDSFFTKIMLTRTFTIFMVDMALMTVVSIAILEVKDKYGPGMFWAMISGEYNQPVVENRIFIFLDINEATSIAETLGHERYFRMLRRFFADITMPVLASEGEIYQYVGDEVVLSWPNTPENKLQALRFLRYAYFLMERKAAEYEKRFGYIPRFKAGVHAGEVTAGFVGVVKKELLYTGDTVNTTARIRGICHDVNESFVLSGAFMSEFDKPHGYRIKAIGRIELKGKVEWVKLYSMRFE
ncbi:adenylate/guanylate cyclase domain-containing protein [Flaviaesturariibacter aridisoli]|uniref:Adenylate/guanylate cyclase domain-containing protein n=1 Tax=Flaviaesturariibacter aridisoli TaxID=2545761 RepID=A0A4R4DXP6_9BACT|nr:adenylate/guanylate cyclase domain-containing protein [Flaviaesturariibacter aridisoli]TCZ69886.1 adenylate/guanylate cyclase domain-containing protein [Flaviaesturariibacter aridisoli]